MKKNIIPYILFLLIFGMLMTACGSKDRRSADGQSATETDTGTDASHEQGKLTDDKMKNRNYKLEYAGADGNWKEFDVLSVKTLYWDGWDNGYSTAGYANIRTEEDSLRIRVNRPGTTNWNIVGNGVSNITTARDKTEMTVPKGTFVSVEANGNRVSNLMVQVSSPVDEACTGEVKCTREIRLTPGVYDVNNCKSIWEMQGASIFRLKSGDHLILEEGAVLKAGIVADNCENIAITGAGIIDTTDWNGLDGDAKINAVKLNNCRNVYISDVTVRNSAFFCVRGIVCENVEIKNISAFSAVFEGDGIDFHGVENLKVSGCVLRNSDDCIALYPSQSDVRNVQVDNCVLWTDRAHNINLGTHGSGDPDNRHYLEDISFSNIYAPESSCPSPDYQGVIGISLGDEIHCRNLKFTDFIIEQYSASQVFVIKVMKLDPWNPSPGYLIEDVELKNIDFRGSKKPTASVFGYSSDRIVKNVTVENYMINGVSAKTFEEAGITVGNYTENITLK